MDTGGRGFQAPMSIKRLQFRTKFSQLAVSCAQDWSVLDSGSSFRVRGTSSRSQVNMSALAVFDAGSSFRFRVAGSRSQANMRAVMWSTASRSCFVSRKRGCEAQFRPVGLNCHSKWGRRMPRITASASDVGFSGQEAGDESEYVSQAPFPRLNVRDPYKLLGIGRDASEEEIREAHNYLSSQYAHHEKSRESIEAAYDKIIMESFRDRKKAKINLKANIKKKVAESPPWVQAITKRFEVPASQIILQRAALFFLLGVWSAMNPSEGGPAFQVAVSLAACIYFLNDRLKSLGRAFLIGFGALVVGWLSGSFLIPVLSSYIIPPSWSLELSTALFSYIFLWVACTFLK